MKKAFVLLLLAAYLSSALFSKGAVEQTPKGGKTELIVFAAASLTETLTTLKNIYEEKNPSISLTMNFDSSGTLKTQIQEGAECDLFLSASPRQMEALSQQGLLMEDSRTDLLENQIVLAVPEGNQKAISSFEDLAERLQKGDVFLAIGNSDVPVGQYTQSIFSYYGLEEKAIQQSLTYGSSVKEVTTQISASSVDCGIVYATDAFSAGLKIIAKATKAMTGGRVLYPAAVLASSRHLSEAQDFLTYLKSPEATTIFESVGFASAL